eukprot:CAMPEP_0174720672 /NCGR_PEP_ID=MMETSP1094-20130205/34165_1 /TAXON_ID=156173 /ORGANISM="Chrysochromulina brevifilum, Strain UTEX LB 985" /LENGTH=56 /DNA_ID=CAMNT_0015921191 /DNA_START=530 /DNA_END=700 /DNA_ORIENTATION=-
MAFGATTPYIRANARSLAMPVVMLPAVLATSTGSMGETSKCAQRLLTELAAAYVAE